MLHYSKYKDADPVDTLKKINSILVEIGIKTDVTWVDSGINNIYSNHISISNSSFGTNGKGTSKEYTLASGYAELIERMQNGLLLSIQYNRIANQVGFLYSPDETIKTTEELAAQDDAFLKFIFNFFHIETPEEKNAFLREFPRMDTLSQNFFRCLPFADPAKGHIVYIPVDILFPICGSNGMASGNTPEEALVQALSEILERYANKAVLEGVVPPEIPREYWKKTGISQLVNEIEHDGRYRVSIRDCSLGRGLPVTAVVITDCKNGKFGIHFGCHPSFEVSVERSLTEALQGKNLENAASMNEIGDSRLCNSIDNGPNLMKLGYGAYPISFFADEPSYAFVPRDEQSGLTNLEMMKKLLEIIHREGFDVLVRDASHLGFPTYHVLVPGMSELFFTNGRRIRELRTANRVIESMKNFPDFSPEEENRLMLYMKYKRYSAVENSFSWISKLPLKGDIYITERIRAFLHYKRAEYTEAYEWFRRASELTCDDEEKYFLLCAAEYAWLMHVCADTEKVARTVKCYFRADAADKVHELLRDPSQTMKKAFEKFPCHDCENCLHNGSNCEFPRNEKALLKIQTAIAKSSINQNNTLAFLVNLGIV